MNQYLIDTKHCTTELIKLIFEEESDYKRLCIERDILLGKSKFYYNEYTSKDLHEDFSELQVMHDFMRMAEAKKEANDIQLMIDKLKISIASKDFSLRALCGALLQIAKQGISFVNGSFVACPDGRRIGNETLKNVIWQARNQSLHFEEGKPKLHVRQCFSNLENDFGNEFNCVRTENLAKNVVMLLNWVTYEQYEFDMVSLLG